MTAYEDTHQDCNFDIILCVFGCLSSTNYEKWLNMTLAGQLYEHPLDVTVSAHTTASGEREYRMA